MFRDHTVESIDYNCLVEISEPLTGHSSGAMHSWPTLGIRCSSGKPTTGKALISLKMCHNSYLQITSRRDGKVSADDEYDTAATLDDDVLDATNEMLDNNADDNGGETINFLLV